VHSVLKRETEKLLKNNQKNVVALCTSCNTIFVKWKIHADDSPCWLYVTYTRITQNVFVVFTPILCFATWRRVSNKMPALLVKILTEI
jgi:hypothetical protein